MSPDYEEVLSRLVDGELVDPAELRAALAEPDASDLLVGYATVHRAVADTTAVPSDRFYDAMRGHLVTTAMPVRRWAWRLPLAAAAMVLVSVLGGIWLAQRTALPVPPPQVASRTATAPTPPAAPLQVAEQPGVGRQVSAGCPTERPPRPVRVLEFKPGVDWQAGSRSTGNEP